MATLKIWNIEDEIVLEDESETMESLEILLDSFNDEHDLDSSGGLGYDFKVSVYDEMLLLKDELEDEEGNIVGRYEMKA